MEGVIVRGFVALASLPVVVQSEMVRASWTPGFSSRLRVATIFPKVVIFNLRLSGKTGIVSARRVGKLPN